VMSYYDLEPRGVHPAHMPVHFTNLIGYFKRSF